MTDRDELIDATEVIAQAVDAHAIGKYKYDQLRVEFPKLPNNDEYTKALYLFTDIIEKSAN